MEGFCRLKKNRFGTPATAHREVVGLFQDACVKSGAKSGCGFRTHLWDGTLSTGPKTGPISRFEFWEARLSLWSSLFGVTKNVFAQEFVLGSAKLWRIKWLPTLIGKQLPSTENGAGETFDIPQSLSRLRCLAEVSLQKHLNKTKLHITF